MNLLILLLACGGAPEPSGTPAPQPVGGQHPPPGPPPALAMLSEAEDLSSSWRPDLQHTIQPAKTTKLKERPCPDGTLRVPAGPFLMGSASTHAGRDEKPVHRVMTDGFCMDRTEVSAGAMAAWYQKTGRTPSGMDPINPDRAGKALPGKDKHPAEGVTWQEASDFCEARGARLPREAEWEKAARGGCERGQDQKRCDPEDLQPYPWGKQTPSCALANHQQVGAGGPRLCHDGALPVDSLPEGAGPYGHLHLAGNVWEYVGDAWHPRVYRAGRPANPIGPPFMEGGPRVLRGGGWNTFSTNMRAANRFHDLVAGSAAGFRCVTRGSEAYGLDLVPPLETVKLSGTITRKDGKPITGRALYVTAFDASEVDPQTGMPAPGRSPVAEVHVTISGAPAALFTLPVPKGGTYRISAALDDGSGGTGLPAAGSGGVGMMPQPVKAQGSTSGLSVVLGPPPGHRQHP